MRTTQNEPRQRSTGRTARARALAVTLVVAAGTSLLAPPSSAAAADWIIQDGAPHDRSQHLDFTLSAWIAQLGVAGWYSYPIVPNGFFPDLNDSFHLEAGAYLSYYQSWADEAFFGVAPLGGVRWDFHLTPQWTAFATAKLGALLGVGYSESGFVVGPSAGACFTMSEGLSLRLEMGYPGGIQAGISMDLAPLATRPTAGDQP